MDHQSDRLVVISRALLGEEGIERLTIGTEDAKRIDDAWRPVHAGDDLTAFLLWAVPGRNLDDLRQVTIDELPGVPEGLLIRAGGSEPGAQMILTDDTKVLRLDRPGVLLHGPEQRTDAPLIDAV